MLRTFALSLALLLPLPALAQQSDGLQSFGLSIEGGGHPSGSYYGLMAEARAGYDLSWGDVTVDLTLGTADAGSNSLTTAGALVHVSARPYDWLAVGPYAWLGSQGEGPAAYGFGVEAAVMTGSGWGGELWFGETFGGVLGEGTYATNKGLRVRYDRGGRFSGYGELSKDTANLTAGDQDFYRLALGFSTWLDLPGSSGTDRAVKLSVAAGQHHFDLLNERDNWVSVGFSIPLKPTTGSRPEFSSRRGVTHYLPMP
ncbi:MAG: hypothetical protein JXQ91_07405 [Vannielia sp.]|uniref:hypothetical protein n=1 Tax=Vannielia sp. TaxID=2813045 RepID=UPI003B8D4573